MTGSVGINIRAYLPIELINHNVADMMTSIDTNMFNLSLDVNAFILGIFFTLSLL
jgi:hypothetical protein